MINFVGASSVVAGGIAGVMPAASALTEEVIATGAEEAGTGEAISARRR